MPTFFYSVLFSLQDSCDSVVVDYMRNKMISVGALGQVIAIMDNVTLFQSQLPRCKNVLDKIDGAPYLLKKS